MKENIKRLGQKNEIKSNEKEPISIKCGLEKLGKITLEQIENTADKRYELWKKYIEKYHYIGHGILYGLQMRYLIKSEYHGWLGAISYSSAAWRLGARDKWIGWNEENRLKHLSRIVCNSRFLLLPYVQVKNLASHVLSKSVQQVKKDWFKKYGVEPALVETFVEKGRYSGTCYQAANFQYVGETKGRGRQDRTHETGLPVKEIYIYPLASEARKQLCLGQEAKNPKLPVDWVEEEFEKADLGDERLKNRLYEIVRDFYGKPEANIPQACQSRARTKAAYRFFDNREITMRKILEAHYRSTGQRIQKEKVVLAVQDTTSLNYSTHPAAENLGPIGSQEDSVIGLLMHDTMAFNLEGTPLGLINVQCWARNREEYGKRHKRYKLPIEEKESRK